MMNNSIKKELTLDSREVAEMVGKRHDHLIGDILGISANMVGRLANQYNLKTSEFGQFFYDKAKHSNKQVETFRYYEKVVPILKSLIHEAKIDKTPQN